MLTTEESVRYVDSNQDWLSNVTSIELILCLNVYEATLACP
jgi:hypothetical protein